MMYNFKNNIPEEFETVVEKSLLLDKLNKNIMQGYRTYTGLLLMFLGILGWGDLISSTQAGNLINAVTDIVGLVYAIYGNYQAHQQIAKLGGY